MKLVGCTVDELRAHLESTWTEGMSWETYGRGENCWVIDHIKPLASFEAGRNVGAPGAAQGRARGGAIRAQLLPRDRGGAKRNPGTSCRGRVGQRTGGYISDVANIFLCLCAKRMRTRARSTAPNPTSAKKPPRPQCGTSHVASFRVESNVSDEDHSILRAHFVEDQVAGVDARTFIMRPMNPPPWLLPFVNVDTEIQGTFLIHRSLKAFDKRLYVGDMDYMLVPLNGAARCLATA